MSAELPRVSVVVIVRDGERFLGEALDSIEAQSYGAWEAIVVDDGSRDGTRGIAERAAQLGRGRIRVLGHEGGANRGMSASRNLGIAAASGEFVTFLDHDDRMEPARLARQVAVLDAHPAAAAAFGPNIRWTSWQPGCPADTMQDLGVALDRILPPPGTLPQFLARTSATPQGLMVRRAVAESLGGFEEAFTDMYEDQVFLAKVMLAHPVFAYAEPLQRYRQHADSCVQVARRAGSHLAARRRFLRWLLAYRPAQAPHAASVRAEARRQLRRSWIDSLRLLLRVR